MARRLMVVLVLGVLAWAVWRGSGESPDRPSLQADADRAAALFDAGDWAGSADLYLAAAERARRADAEDLALAWRAQAAVGLKLADELDRARGLLEPALQQARARGDVHTEGLVLGNLARVAGLQGRLDEALTHQDALADFARRHGEAELEVKTLEQAADTALDRGDVEGAGERLTRALQVDAGLPPGQRRHAALMRQLAWSRVEAGDDEGAAALWLQVPASAAATANQARHLSLLGLHEQAADLAREAAASFETEGELRHPQRDRALQLAASSLLRARQMRDSFDMLATVVRAGGDPVALAPFEVLRGRHAMARQDWSQALEHFDVAASAASGLEDGEMLPWLRATTLAFAERYPEARQALIDRARSGPQAAERPYDTVTALLLGWTLVQQPPEHVDTRRLLLDLALSLRPDPTVPIDTRLQALRDLCPHPLPSLSWVALELHMQVADRQRDDGDAAGATASIRRGVHDALVWQALEACDRVRPGWLPRLDRLSRVQAWVDGELDPDEAVLSVIVGENRSYLALCTSELGATTLGIPPRFALRKAMGDVVEALRGAADAHLASACHDLFKRVFTKRARSDLAGRTRWTMILPDDLTPVPPAMWVPDQPIVGRPVGWLVKTHIVSLLPHALAGSDDFIPVEGWAQIASPTIDRPSLPLSTARMIDRYGAGALLSHPGRSVPMGSRWTADEATAGRLRSAHGMVDVLELSVPGLGGGRLGGLLFSPMPPADEALTSYGDERLGFVPWHRFTEITLPRSLVLDQTRFDPGDALHGAAYAATAVMHNADRVLMTRWPLAQVPSESILEWFSRAVRGSRPDRPIPFSAALAAAQRAYLVQAQENGALQMLHPRAWAGWLVYGTN